MVLVFAIDMATAFLPEYHPLRFDPLSGWNFYYADDYELTDDSAYRTHETFRTADASR